MRAGHGYKMIDRILASWEYFEANQVLADVCPYSPLGIQTIWCREAGANAHNIFTEKKVRHTAMHVV